jgi:hypothetical protein
MSLASSSFESALCLLAFGSPLGARLMSDCGLAGLVLLDIGRGVHLLVYMHSAMAVSRLLIQSAGVKCHLLCRSNM